MADQTLTKLTAAAPLAIAGLLVLLNPIYDRLIEQRAKAEFSNSAYLPEGATHTPMTVIKQYTSWALDVVQAGPWPALLFSVQSLALAQHWVS
jgi:hypothetical protein